ncbi:hypothetical protein V6615_13035 [Oscillospiraceae bacterium PP1C4]
MILFFFILFGAAVIVTAATISLKRCKPLEDELFRIREIPMTAVLGIALWAEAAGILYVLSTVPERLLTNQNASVNSYVFLTVSIILGSGMLLYRTVKIIIVCQNVVVYVSLLGKKTVLRWDEVSNLKLSHSKRLTMISEDGKKITVGGEKQSYGRFIILASQKLEPETGEEILVGLKSSLKL